MAAKGTRMTESPRPIEPPRWMDALLRRVVHHRDRDAIPGDLFEEYRDAILSGESRLRASCRYLVQAGSVIVVVMRPPTTAGLALAALSAVSITGLAWLSFGSPNRAVAPVAAAFVAQGLATMTVLGASGRFAPWLLQPGAVAVALGGSLALVETFAWTAFDWKVALTGASLLVQGLLTVALQAGCFGGFGSGAERP
jgi:hypothetical protein